MKCPITAVFPTCNRIEATLRTLRVLTECEPSPSEIIVLVDGGDDGMLRAIGEQFPNVRMLSSTSLLGPGGSRNRLIAAAANELVANFDDDSFPARPDYFARIMELATLFPDAAMLSAASQPREWASADFQSIAVPSGCGCVFRKSWFEQTAGFVPLTIAFNMEEVDIGLQLHALGGVILHDPELRVVHDHPVNERRDPRTNATVLANTVLLPFLRYPVLLWPAAFWHLFSQTRNFIRRGFAQDIWPGLQMMPSYFWRHRKFRKVMPARAVWSWLRLRRNPVPLGARACSPHANPHSTETEK